MGRAIERVRERERGREREEKTDRKTEIRQTITDSEIMEKSSLTNKTRERAVRSGNTRAHLG